MPSPLIKQVALEFCITHLGYTVQLELHRSAPPVSRHSQKLLGLKVVPVQVHMFSGIQMLLQIRVTLVLFYASLFWTRKQADIWLLCFQLFGFRPFTGVFIFSLLSEKIFFSFGFYRQEIPRYIVIVHFS